MNTFPYPCRIANGGEETRGYVGKTGKAISSNADASKIGVVFPGQVTQVWFPRGNVEKLPEPQTKQG